ncbi:MULTISPECIES: carbohydrate ABC transporter permease [unclassified Streptomyces]|jgi:raffinose/stachyose/melibiose transport system permease protein|uniref:carbohydrate ABC transporter permease n=1 Tax=unclassified Streptomyces TaxID=2593676 RepID=UPI00088339BE|nr:MULTISPECIES: carbohydrate ABC transporter permease [unclassified Streptomyces]MDX2730223.1 carbohydrate ABC transporter permease [Streptomyces sp. PA03-2a]MDX3768908.1 carbohydrate ABC transporter permease [Streptomyces sp. AK08-01B]MDX3815688.1 carbohydrate ABC transporter permease [Streptomyces sp. AK08-01A]SCY01463.1 carbohydrate ABC transporter membrane protein 2, CUT1 family [Streptomyces sp. 136MFCol5.1]SFS37662.1 carbohydrate ABC transporter membrane protein 2, CUT1 family [Streptom
MGASTVNSRLSSAVEPDAPIDRGNRDKPQKWGNPFTYFIALLFIGVCIAPVLYIVLGGFRTNSQISTSPAALPHPWVASNYVSVLKSVTFWGEFANSIIVGLVSTVGTVVLGLMVSFVLARYDFKLKGAMYSLFAAGLMFPLVIAITPLYIVVKDLGLVDNLFGVIIPQIAFGLPTTVIILVPFLRAIPNEIEEAAAIDGASRLGFFFRMVIPLSLPGVVTVGILGFIGSWNNYVLPLYVINSQANFTLPLGVQAFSSQYSVDTARVLAFTSLAMLPALIFFAIFEKKIVGGLTGAVKG